MVTVWSHDKEVTLKQQSRSNILGILDIVILLKNFNRVNTSSELCIMYNVYSVNV